MVHVSTSLDNTPAFLISAPLASNAHVLDLTTHDGLLAFIAVGNVLEFSVGLSRPHYVGDLTQEDEVEQKVARWRFRFVLKAFCEKHTLLLGDTWVHPLYLAKRLLVEFAAALTVYKSRQESMVPLTEKCDARSLNRALHAHLKADYPELVPLYLSLVKAKHGFFYWTGPRVRIGSRTRQFSRFLAGISSTELLQLDTFPLYPIDGDVPGILDDAGTGARSKRARQRGDDGTGEARSRRRRIN